MNNTTPTDTQIRYMYEQGFMSTSSKYECFWGANGNLICSRIELPTPKIQTNLNKNYITSKQKLGVSSSPSVPSALDVELSKLNSCLNCKSCSRK